MTKKKSSSIIADFRNLAVDLIEGSIAELKAIAAMNPKKRRKFIGGTLLATGFFVLFPGFDIELILLAFITPVIGLWAPLLVYGGSLALVAAGMWLLAIPFTEKGVRQVWRRVIGGSSWKGRGRGKRR